MVGVISLVTCFSQVAIAEDEQPKQLDTSVFGKRIDDPAQRFKEALFSFSSATISHGWELKINCLYDPGAPLHAIVPCYLSEFGDSILPFVDRFELLVHQNDGSEQVIKLRRAHVDLEVGAVPRLYDIVIPRLDGPPRAGIATIGFRIDSSLLPQSTLMNGKLQFPLTISLRFSVRMLTENGSAAGELQEVQTEKCTISQDRSELLVLKTEGRNRTTTRAARNDPK